MIRLIVDSTCDMREELFQKYNVGVVPLQVFIDGQAYLDRKTISTDTVYHAMEANKKIQTALPPLPDMAGLFETCAKEGQPFLFLPFSGKMSGTCGVAKGILENLKKSYPNVPMEVVDSKAGALGTGLIAEKILKKSGQTDDFEELLSYAQYCTQHIQHIFMVNDLTQLAKGGRIHATVASLGNVMHIRPILNVVDGEIVMLTQARGTKRALAKLSEIVKQRIGNPKDTVGLAYANRMDLAENMEALLREECGCSCFEYEKIGSVLSSHIGLDAVGVFFFDIPIE